MKAIPIVIYVLLSGGAMPGVGQVLWGGSDAGAGNWVAKAVPVIATHSVQTARDSALVSVQHLDGLGRIYQTKQFRAGSPAKAMGGFTVYDAQGRVAQEWLPAPIGRGALPADLYCVSGAQADTRGMYTAIGYEKNPLSRECSRLRPGRARHTSGKAVKTEYLYNTTGPTDETFCPHLTEMSRTLKISGKWKRGEVSVRRVTDEDGNRLLTFTDARGHVLLERSISSSGRRSDLMHYYDERGRLWLSITPAACDQLIGGSAIRIGSDESIGSIYIYNYDSKDRPCAVSVPGGGITRTLFTPGDQPALVQDGALRGKGKALRSVYDRLGRHLYTGTQAVSAAAIDSCLLTSGLRSEAVSIIPATGGIYGYTPTTPINGQYLKAADVLKVDYWDNYNWLSLNEYSAVADSLAWRQLPGMDSRGNAQISRGRQTGSMRRLIGPDGAGQFLLSAVYYDSRGRAVQTVAQNAAGGYCRSSLRLSHDGRVLGRIDTESTPDTSLYTERRYSYTPELRLSRVEMRHSPTGQWRELTQIAYDRWGRPQTETLLGGGINTEYTYTATGELEKQSCEPWEMTIYRERDLQGNKGYLNGRVKAEAFRLSQTESAGGAAAQGRYLAGSYTYSYDGERLMQADYIETARVEGSPGALKASEVAVDPDYSTSYSYDTDGNLTLISRNGLYERQAGGMTGGAPGGGIIGGTGLGGTYQPASKTYRNVDNICLSYEGGQLVKADDCGWDCTLSMATDWCEKTQSAREYTYDMDGRMTADRNKGITSITYNVLGLPETVTTATGLIRNTYDADGRLVVRSYGTMEWVTTDLGFTTHSYQAYREERRVDYVGDLTLEDGALFRRNHEAGWTDAQGHEVAAVHDYRGSLRATWTDTASGTTSGNSGNSGIFIPGSGSNVKIYGNLMAYYPYGLPWADWQGSDRWLYGGKEFEREHGLHSYDFHARTYDPGLGRFTAPDPLATKYEHLNPFLYCAANPITFTDPTGCELHIYNSENATPTKVNYEWLTYSDSEYSDLMTMMGFGNKSYVYQVLSAYRYLMKSPTGAEAIKDIIDSKYIVQVKRYKGRNYYEPENPLAATADNEETKANMSYPIIGSGGTIHWDPDLIHYGMCENSEEPSIPAISLGHESGHAYFAIQGLSYIVQDKYQFSNKVIYNAFYNKILKEEWQGVYFENTLRKECKLPLRYYYNGLSGSMSNGYNHSTKMVNSKGEPIKYEPEKK